MDLSRYADLVVNVILTTMCFFTTSGWVLRTLMGLLLGNVFVYVFDHWRVLRQVEYFYFASGLVDIITQWLLVIPCGILASACVFQIYGFGLKGVPLWNHWLDILAVFVVHCLLHSLALCCIVPYLSRVEHKQTDEKYEEVAKVSPGNWFSTNPVHCLRSKYVHLHSPPCIYHIRGKEHVMERNESLGLFYSSSSNYVKPTESHLIERLFSAPHRTSSSIRPGGEERRGGQEAD